MYLSKTVKAEDKSFTLQIWDTAGQEKYKAVAPVYLRDSDIVIFVCDLTRKDTYFGLNDWVQLAKNYSPGDAAWIFLGNKCDQRTELWDVSEKNIAEISSKHQDRTSNHHFLTSGIALTSIQELLTVLGKIAHTRWKERSSSQVSSMSTRLKQKMGMKTPSGSNKKKSCC
jgi:small GTP-binding protein